MKLQQLCCRLCRIFPSVSKLELVFPVLIRVILRPHQIGVERIKVLQNISFVCFNSHSQSVFYNLGGFEKGFCYFLDTSSDRY